MHASRTLLSHLNSFFRVAAVSLAGLQLGFAPPSTQAATLYWDTDASTAGNSSDGTGLGGSGTWDVVTGNWWDGSVLTTWPNSGADVAIFSSPFAALPVATSVTLNSGISANQIAFLRSGFLLTGGDLTLAGASPTFTVNLGESATIESLVHGTAGLNLAGGGTLRLDNTSNDYTGTTTLSNGTLVITSQGALGLDGSAVVVSGNNPVIGSTNLRGFGGGSLFLNGLGGSVDISRDLSLQGFGPIADRGGALLSTGVNTLSGVVTMGTPFSGTNLSTRVIAADGTLNFTGTLNVLGTAATTISNLGGVNQAGASFYNVSGILAGTGTLEGSGGGTLFLNPSDSSGFSGTIRVSGSAASGQSVVRIDSAGVLGTRTAGTTSAVLDLNGGILAVLMDTPDVKVSNGSNANVYFRAASTIFADHTPGSSTKDQTVAFGNMSFEDNITLTFSSRNGYGMSFTTAPVNGGNANTTLTNNLQGGALLSFTGNFWSNADAGAARSMTIGGNGNTLINGNIIASGGASFDHILTKSGSGTLTLTGTASTLDGAVNVQGGTVAVNDFRAVTNNTSNINIGSGSTSAIFSIVGNNATLANLTTGKVFNLSGSTGGATILANQTGTSPGVVLNADFTATGGGSKTLTLGGANAGANTINGTIVNNSGTNLTSVTKIDSGRWILAGENTYTGSTTIANGILQIKANAAASTVIADTSAIIFNTVNVYAVGTLEFLGQASTNNVENLGALTPTTGAGTIKLTPGSGGTASLTFASLGTVGDGSGLNIVGADPLNNIVTVTGLATGLASPRIYFDGADFAYSDNGVLRVPVYDTDATFVSSTGGAALSAGQNNFLLTGDLTAQGSQTIRTLKIDGSRTITLNAGATLTVRTGANNTDGGILATGGSSVITGGTSVQAGGSGTLTIRVDGGADILTLETPINAGTGGLTKNGAGTLRLAGANAQTGTISINEGTVRLVTGGSLGGAAAVTIRQDAVLELNGVTPPNNITSFNNNGIVRNTSATTDVVLTVGGSNGTGTSNGIIEDGGLASISVVKLGTGAQSWLGLSTYSGSTTIGSTGIVSINNLQDGGMPSGIGASSNAAANLIFNGASATQAYGGISYTGTTNDATDRLFTFDGGADGGVRIQSNGVNGATSSWTNPGALAFGPNAAGNPQGLVLGGSSTGDNRFFPIIGDNGAAATSVYKADTGVWYLQAANTYTGPTELRGGALYVTDGVGLPTDSNLVFNGGILASSGSFSRTIGTGASQMRFATPAATSAMFRGGFAAGGSKLTVDWGAGNVWGTTTGFLDNRDGLIFGAMVGQTSVTKAEVEVTSDFSLGTATHTALGPGLSFTIAQNSANVTVVSTAGLAVGQSITGTNIPSGAYIVSVNSATQFTMSANTANTGGIAGTYTDGQIHAQGLRAIRVDDNTLIGADFTTLSGVISGDAGTGIRKVGGGILVLSGANTYDGETNIAQGTLVVSSLGHSASPGATSIGSSANGSTTAALTLGNGGTGGGILEYVGAGEVSDRYIRLNTTTGSNQIHADGAGPLILTNVANDLVAGAKTLILRGVNAMDNRITSVLADNGAALSVTVDGSASWILSGANTYTGTTTIGAGALGIGHDSALGTSSLTLSSGTVFAHGGDRTLTNAVTQGNNTTTGFTGDYSITLGNVTGGASANNWGTNNNLAAGKTLTFGSWTVNSLTANRAWTIDGTGTTIIDGSITTSTAFGVVLTKTGDGVLVLNGTASNYNQNNANTDIDRGILRMGADNVIPSGAGFGGVLLAPELANGDTAIWDLNGTSQSVNALTANTDGTSIIDNMSATAATLTFGANDSAVSFGGGIGTYTIQNSGGGALSLMKTGAGVATIPTGVTLTYTGTTGATGGTFTISSPVNGTTGLSATGGSTLALTGGIATPGAITSIEVGAGSTLNLLDGAGTLISNLTSLSLGNTGSGTAALNLNIGDLVTAGDGLSTDTLTLLTSGTLALGNTITFNMTDAGLNPGTTYTLLSVTDGGLSALGLGNFIQGATPGGFSGFTWDVQDTYVKITTGTLITGSSYWRGLTDTTWNAAADNWSQDKAGTMVALSIPGQGTDVIFQWDAPTSAAVTTTLEQNFKINSLTFEPSTTPANTPASITIDPGVNTTSRLEIAPQVATDGIEIATDGPAAVTISAAVRIGKDQTWNVADAGSVLSLGPLFGEAAVTKTGDGKVTLTSAADNTFNSGVTAAFTIDAGTLEILTSTALGSTINSNLASITVNSTGVFYYNGAANSAATGVANNITLAGGTLSVGGNAGNNYHTGTVTVTADSFINMRGSNSAVVTATQGNVVLSGPVSGSGKLTVDSINTLSGGNQITGVLYFQGDNSTWSGGIDLVRGTIQSQTVTGFGTGAITASAGRLQFVTPGGTTFNLAQNITIDAPGGMLELSADASGTPVSDLNVNLTGVITIGSATNANNALRLSQASDNFSIINISNSIVLGNNASISYQGSSVRALDIGAVISDGGSGYSLAINDELGGWGVTSRTVRLSGVNSFSGDISITEGALEFSTVSDVGGAASNLGQGSAITIGSATLRFVGSTSQTTDRAITGTGAAILSAAGLGGATITYTSPVTVNPTADGTQFTLTGIAGSEGILGAGFVMTGDTADAVVSGGGTWTITGGTSRVGDVLTLSGGTTLNLNGGVLNVRNDFVVSGTGTTLYLNASGVLSYSTTTLSADASLLLRDGAVVELGANDAVVATDFDRLFIGQDAGGLTPTLNMGVYNLTTSRLILGERANDRNGLIDGTGVLTITGGDIDLYEGTINAGLASTGTTALEKFGPGTVTLAGDNSGLASTGASVVAEGTLVLDFGPNTGVKLRTGSALELRGSSLTLMGNAGTAVSQTVASFTLDSTASDDNAGAAKLSLISAGQDVLLTLGAITRATGNRDGTIRFVLPAGVQSATNGIITNTVNTNGLLGASAYATVDDGTGVWFATNATNAAGGNIVALASIAKNDVSTWVTADHVTDDVGGFSGTVSGISINSLRFNAASGSDLNLGGAGVLSIASGGILVTSNVGGTPSIVGGTLLTGINELIITQDSAQTFEINADIRGPYALTKSGAGTLLLSGNNFFTDELDLQEGVLQVAGGNAIGDISIVSLAAHRQTTLELLDDETIGRLSGGQRATNSENGIVDVGVHTLTINQGANSTYAGTFAGTGAIIKDGPSNLQLTGISTGFTGGIIVESGTFYFTTAGQINASFVQVNKGGVLLFDQNGSTGPSSHILDTTSITLNSADGTFSGQSIVRGLAIRTDNNSTRDETVGVVNLNSGANYVGMETTVAGADADIITNNITRLNNSTLNVRGNNLGIVNTRSNQFRIGDATNQDAFIASAANLVGGAGGDGSTNLSIVPWAIGEETGAGALAAGHMGNSLVTYILGTGFRPLNFATEYATYAAAAATDNVRESLSADLTGLSGATINSLVLNNAATPLLSVSGSGAGQTLAITSGAMLFTVTGAAANDSLQTSLGGFDDGIAVGGTNEYVIQVINPNSSNSLASGTTTLGSTTITVTSTTGLMPGMPLFGAGIPVGAVVTSVTSATAFEMSLPSVLSTSSQTFIYATNENLAATISSPLTSTADITKSGRGTLILTGANTAGGGTRKTTINEGVLEITDLDNIGGDTGALVFAGGTLRLGSGLTDDISLRTISFLAGGGTIDTNGVDLVLAGSVGSGIGGLTKTGAGNLTLNLAATYSGDTVILGGTLTIGASNALGLGGDITLGAGATLDVGGNSLSAGLFTTAGVNPSLLGTGTINASRGFVFGNTGDLPVSTQLAGPGGLLKLQNNILTLSGLNTYSGTTEIRGGTLSIDSISGIGGGASALGSVASAEDGIIRMGSGSTATTLQYTGSGHISDRLIGMQGTTGAVTIDADGTGVLVLGGVRIENPGNKTLTLRGDSDPALENAMGPIVETAGVLTFTKADANTWVMTASNAYSGATRIDDGILRFTADQNLAGALTFGTANSITTAGRVEAKADLTFGGLIAQTNSDTLVNILDIDASRTVTVTGNVSLGSGGATTTTFFSAVGEGTFNVSNTTGTGNTFIVGGSNTNFATADFSALKTMNVSLDTTSGVLLVSSTSGTNSTGTGTLILAQDTTITAGALTVGGGGSFNGNSGQVNSLQLGTSTNIINVDAFNVGTGSRDLGAVSFLHASDGTVVVRAADGVSAAAFNMGTGSATTTVGVGVNQNSFDVTGHAADLKFSTVTIGTQNRNSDLASVFRFDTGTLEIGTLNASSKGSNGSTTTTNIEIGGGTVTSGAWTLASTSGAGNAVANATFTGGTLTFSGSILRGADSAGGGTATGTVTLDGATLDMQANTIGSATNDVVFNAMSGTLSNLGELNGGGALTKAGSGTLYMDGVNTNTGVTNVTAGTLQFRKQTALYNNTPASWTDTNIVVSSGATAAFNVGGTGEFTASDIDVIKGLGTATGGFAAGSSIGLDTTNAAGGTFTYASAIADTNLGANSVGLKKLGGNTLELTGDSTYTGATTVSGGTLRVGDGSTGSLGGAGVVTINTGATLSGSGSIAGATIIGNGAILAPGVGSTAISNQKLTFTAAATALEVQDGGQIQLGLTSSSQIDAGFDWITTDALTYLNGLTSNGANLSDSTYAAHWKDAGTTYDSLKLTNGEFNLGTTAGGTIKVSDNSGTYIIGNIFKLLDWSTVGAADSLLAGSGAFTLGDLDLSGIGLGAGLAWDTSAFTSYGVLVVVPEPSRAVFLLLGLSALLMRRRRSK
jgi:fibronectin-binding autotransporter adhesin